MGCGMAWIGWRGCRGWRLLAGLRYGKSSLVAAKPNGAFVRSEAMDADEVGQLDLPAHTHAAILSRRDLRTRRLTVVPVVWADYAFDRCPHCHEELDVVPDCPVTINSAGGVEQVDRMHGCGFWLFTEYLVLPEASETRFLEWGAQVAERRRKKVDADRLD